MANEVRVFIQGLRAGKHSTTAFADYCFARLAVPIRLEDLARIGDPFLCRPEWFVMASAAGADAFDDGGDDDAITAAFNGGMAYDWERGIRYRAMRREERPSIADQIRGLSLEEKMEAVKLFGLTAVAVAAAGGELR